MNYTPVTWITTEEINEHLSTMLYHSKQIDLLKEKLEKPKKNKEVSTDLQMSLFKSLPTIDSHKPKGPEELTPIEKQKIKDFIEDESNSLRWEDLLLKIKLRFFYQNSSGIPLPKESGHRRQDDFSRENYMKLKNANFNRKELARESYLELQMS